MIPGLILLALFLAALVTVMFATFIVGAAAEISDELHDHGEGEGR